MSGATPASPAFAGSASPESSKGVSSRFSVGGGGGGRRRGGGRTRYSRGGAGRNSMGDDGATTSSMGEEQPPASSSSVSAPLSSGSGVMVHRTSASTHSGGGVAAAAPSTPLRPRADSRQKQRLAEEKIDERHHPPGTPSAASATAADDSEEKVHARRPTQKFSLPLLLNRTSNALRLCVESGRFKRLVSTFLACALLLLLADCIFSPPERRLIQPSTFKLFLGWVQTHPLKGLLAYVLVYGFTVVLLIPGTPLTIGSGYIYKMAYGWTVGVTIGSIFSTLGSLLGSVMCFCLGRYLMKERVRRWVRKYPLFNAIDVAVGEQGFKIMALLYLTPILPLGPVSYMCGTTSMKLTHFAAAKIACLPLMVFYVFLGASAGTLVHKGGGGGGGGKGGSTVGAGGGGEGEAASSTGAEAGAVSAESAAVADELDHLVEGESAGMIVFAMALSMVSVALISHFVKKELFKVLDKQKEEGTKDAGGSKRSSSSDHLVVPPATDDHHDVGIEMRRQPSDAGEQRKAAARQRRSNLGPGSGSFGGGGGGAPASYPSAEDAGVVEEGSHGKDV